MTIMITGGTGFVGAAVADHLARMGRRAVVYAADPAPEGWLPAQASVIIADVRDGAAVKAAMAAEKVTAVIHAAAVTAGPRLEAAIPDEVIAVNVAGTATVLKAAHEMGIGKVILASSVSVYPLDTNGEGRFDARVDRPAPSGLYGTTKLAAEQVAQRLAAVYGLCLPIVRLAAVYGPFERPTAVRETLSPQAQIVALAERGEEVRLSRPGFGGWLYSRDAAAALVALIDKKFPSPPPVFDLGGPEVFSALDFCEALAARRPGWSFRICEDAPNIRFLQPADRRPSDFIRLQAATGFKPRYDLAGAVPDYAEWLDKAH
ncbi:dTDP-L-rhamnose 4-epimerase [bacterium YEK0313]|nr:dTDP-L-rhamnose 4-epimerase [bacterium YEK0313]